MPLFALEQIVLLSFAVREWGRGRPPPRERQKRARYEDGTSGRQRDGVDRSSACAFSGLFCLSSWCVLEASSCILTLITGADTMARTTTWRRDEQLTP